MLIYQDGFEQYGDMDGFLWGWESQSGCDLTGEPRDDHGVALRMADGGQATLNFNQHKAIYIGIAVNAEIAGEGFNVRFQDANDADQATFTMNADGRFQLRLGGPSDTVVQTAKRKMFGGRFYYLEFRVEIDPRFGSIHFRLSEEIGLAIINTATEVTGNGITKVRFENSTGGDITFDDMYVIDQVREEYWDKWLGDIKVNTYRLSGDSSPLQWHTLVGETITVGPHWEQIEEQPADGDLTSIDAGDWNLTDQFTATQDQLEEPNDGAVMAISFLAMINNTGTKPNPNHTGSDWRLAFQLIRGSDGLVSDPSGTLDRPLPFRYSYQCFNLVRWRPEGAHFAANIMDTSQVRITARPVWPQ